LPTILAAVISLALVAHYAPVLVWLGRAWLTLPVYSHGVLVVPLLVLLVWLARKRIALARCGMAWGGLALVVVALAARRWDLGADEPAVAAFGIPLAIIGAVWTLAGREIAKIIAVPVLILLLAVPLPPPVLASAGMRIEYGAATVGAALLEHVLTIPALREGVMIHLPRVSLEMGIQPAAMRTLMVFMTFAAFYACLLAGPPWKRWLVFVAGIPISMLGSGVRVSLDGLVGHILGPEAMRASHLYSGYIALIVAFVALLVFARSIGCSDLQGRDSSSSP